MKKEINASHQILCLDRLDVKWQLLATSGCDRGLCKDFREGLCKKSQPVAAQPRQTIRLETARRRAESRNVRERSFFLVGNSPKGWRRLGKCVRACTASVQSRPRVSAITDGGAAITRNERCRVTRTIFLKHGFPNRNR